MLDLFIADEWYFAVIQGVTVLCVSFVAGSRIERRFRSRPHRCQKKKMKNQYRDLARMACNEVAELNVFFNVYHNARVEKTEAGALVTIKVWVPNSKLPKENDGDSSTSA